MKEIILPDANSVPWLNLEEEDKILEVCHPVYQKLPGFCDTSVQAVITLMVAFVYVLHLRNKNK